MHIGQRYQSHLWVAFFCLLFGLSGQAQSCLSRAKTTPFTSGESITYSLTYQWGLLWLPAGNVTFTVSDTTLTDARNGWHFKGEGASLDTWDWFYKVRSTYASVCDSACTPLEFVRQGQEGSYVYDRSYRIQPGDSALFVRKDPSKPEQSWPIALADSCAYDVISAIYRVRSLDLDELKAGTRFPFKLILDGAVHEISILYEGEKVWKDPRSGKKYACHLIRPDLISGTVFKEGDSMKVFVSNDNRQIPLYIETDLVVGKARIFLTGAKNLLPPQ